MDDHAGFRTEVRSLLVAAGYEVVGVAEDGMSALLAVGELQPEVVILDVQLPDIDGFEVARALYEQPAPPAVILVSSRDESDYGGRIDRSPARGFIPKTELSAQALTNLLEEAT